MHRRNFSPRQGARERIAREYCHGRSPMDAPRRNIAAVGRRGTQFASILPSASAGGMYQGMILPRLGARAECPAPRLPFGPRRRTPLVPCHSAMYRNVMHRSATDARVERSRPCPTRPTLMPRSARRGTTAPCTVRGAFAAAEKVSCGLRVSMRWNEPPVSV